MISLASRNFTLAAEWAVTYVGKRLVVGKEFGMLLQYSKRDMRKTSTYIVAVEMETRDQT